MEVDGRSDGMGARSSGPTFAPPAPGPQPDAQPGHQPSSQYRSQPGGEPSGEPGHGPAYDFPPSGSVPFAPPRRPNLGPAPLVEPASLHPPRRVLPVLVTVLAVAVVGGAVVFSSLAAGRDDQVATAPVTVTPIYRTTLSPANQIAFSTAYGDGVLIVKAHRWEGGTLTVTVTVTATEGEIDVDPTLFQVMDAQGTVHDIVTTPGGSNGLDAVSLDPSETTTGELRFAVGEGPVTLLMNDGTQTVTAIKVSG